MFGAAVRRDRFAGSPLACAVVASGIATELGGGTGSDHFGGDVSSIGKEALRDQSPISVDVKEGALQFLAGDQAPQGRRRGRPTAMVPFRRVEAPYADVPRFAPQRERVSVKYLADPSFEGICFGALASDEERSCHHYGEKKAVEGVAGPKVSDEFDHASSMERYGCFYKIKARPIEGRLRAESRRSPPHTFAYICGSFSRRPDASTICFIRAMRVSSRFAPCSQRRTFRR